MRKMFSGALTVGAVLLLGCVSSPANAWTLDRYTDPAFNVPSVGIYQNSIQTDDLAGDYAKLTVACIGGVPSIAILFNQDLGESQVSVSLTWPGQSADKEDYATADNDQGVYIYDGTSNSSPALLGDLLSLIDGSSVDTGSGTILNVVAYPDGQPPVKVSFNLSGFEDAYGPVGDQCNIPIPAS